MFCRQNRTLILLIFKSHNYTPNCNCLKLNSTTLTFPSGTLFRQSIPLKALKRSCLTMCSTDGYSLPPFTLCTVEALRSSSGMPSTVKLSLSLSLSARKVMMRWIKSKRKALVNIVAIFVF